MVIVRRDRRRFTGVLPDGLGDLAEHNLITFKSHREALDDWAVRELIAHYVAYRKFVSSSPSDLLPPDRFRLYAVVARYPHNLSGQIPWQERQAGVYDCRWGLDTVRVVVAGQLPREAHNAPLHLFSAAPELIGFGQGVYRRRSQETSLLLGQLFERLRKEGLAMSYTMEDFKRQYIREHFSQLTPEEQRGARTPVSRRPPGSPAIAAGGEAPRSRAIAAGGGAPRSRAIAAGGGAPGSPAIAAGGGTAGGPVRGADPRVPGPVGGGPTGAAAHAAPEEVTVCRREGRDRQKATFRRSAPNEALQQKRAKPGRSYCFFRRLVFHFSPLTFQESPSIRSPRMVAWHSWNLSFISK